MPNIPTRDPLKQDNGRGGIASRSLAPTKQREGSTDADEIKSTPVSTVAPADGQTLVARNGVWTPETIETSAATPSGVTAHDIESTEHNRIFHLTENGGLSVTVEPGRAQFAEITYEKIATPLTLTASSTNRIHVTSVGVVANTTGAFPSGCIPLWVVQTTGGAILSKTDQRSFFARGGGAGVSDHGALTGLADDDHPQYATDTDLTTHAATDTHSIYAMLAGRFGGQSLSGGTVSGNILTLRGNAADATGGVKVVGMFSVNNVTPEAGNLVLARSVTGNDGTISVCADNGGSTTPGPGNVTGVAGRAFARDAGTTGVYGLDYLAGMSGASVAATVSDVAVVRGQMFLSAAGKVITNAYALWLRSPTVIAGSCTNYYGVKIDSVTTGTNRLPFYEAGTAAGDNHGNRLRSNTQFGSTTGQFGGGDGVIGIAQATVLPLGANLPTNGVILYARNVAGTIKLHYRNSTGTEIVLG